MQVVKIQKHPDNLKELVVGNKRFRSPLDFRLSDYDLEICRRELKETEDVRKDSLRKLREMLDSDKDTVYRRDDVYLLRYLRYRKFNCKEAYKHMRNFYKVRSEIPELYYLTPNLKKLLNTQVGHMLPYTTEEGTVVFCIKLGNWKTNEVTLNELLNIFNYASDIFTMNPHSQINGVVDIFDLENVSLTHASCLMQLKNIRLWTKIMQELYPWRVKHLVFVNCNALLYATLASAHRFLKKKIADRIVILRSDLSELHKYVNPAILPKEYGGNLESSECTLYLERCILDNLKYIEYENSFIGVKKP